MDLIPIIKELGAYGVILYLVMHQQLVIIPRLTADFRTSLDAQQAIYTAELKSVLDTFAPQLERISTTLARLEARIDAKEDK